MVASGIGHAQAGETQRRADELRLERARLTRGLARAAALGLDVSLFQSSIQSLDAVLGQWATAEPSLAPAVRPTGLDGRVR